MNYYFSTRNDSAYYCFIISTYSLPDCFRNKLNLIYYFSDFIFKP
jgi:hypothetical protein